MYHAYPVEPLTGLLEQMLSQPLRPTAVFAENWKVCQTILEMARETGVAVPDELSLVALGRNVLEITYPLAITAYVPDYVRIGEKAIALLTAAIDGKAPATKRLEITGRLVERQSVRRIGESLLGGEL